MSLSDLLGNVSSKVHEMHSNNTFVSKENIYFDHVVLSTKDNMIKTTESNDSMILWDIFLTEAVTNLR